ncbi:unnamed protein product [Calicophoron daubneyi]|uniref:Uncharacterized protein n=1 Tax=Calicophoron daubneyi TaxID=300641 RepID=A0AAV2T4K8_CALDB
MVCTATSYEDRQLLKRLVRVGKKKIARLDRKSPGKLLDRHLLCRALHTWRAMRSMSQPQSSWCTVDPPSPSSFCWDDDSNFDSVSSLNDTPLTSDVPPDHGELGVTDILPPLSPAVINLERRYPRESSEHNTS